MSISPDEPKTAKPDPLFILASARKETHVNLFISYQLTHPFVQAETIRTGEMPDAKQVLTIALSDLTEAQRAFVVPLMSVSTVNGKPSAVHLTIDTIPDKTTGKYAQTPSRRHDGSFEFGFQKIEFDHYLTIDEALATLAQVNAAKAEIETLNSQGKAERQAIVESFRLREQELCEKYAPVIEAITTLADANAPLGDERILKLFVDAKKANVELPALSKLLDHKSKKYDELKKAAAEAERQTWIEAHGSAYLKQCEARGYNCQRQYALERASFEYPGWDLDYNNTSAWKDRSGPSQKALSAEIDAPLSRIVWLTAPASSELVDSELYGDEYFESCEALVIRNYLGKYDLVKII